MNDDYKRMYDAVVTMYNEDVGRLVKERDELREQVKAFKLLAKENDEQKQQSQSLTRHV